ncbi:MAG: hypothetical protein HQK66_07810 [Desulfamplus sp.]|nr:hypothetical protein [Desulfamplus sp.]
MNDMLNLIPVLLTGVLLGVMFFGGLWWTVQKGISARHPGGWFFFSLLLRMSLAMAGFYFVSDGHWERLLVSLSGFFIARLIVTRLTGLPVKSPSISLPVKSPGISLPIKCPGISLPFKSPGISLPVKSPGISLPVKCPGISLPFKGPSTSTKEAGHAA